MSKSIRINKRRGYTVIPNGLLPEGKITARAWGIYAYLLSRPDGWVIHVRQLQQVFKEGRDAIYSAMKQLREVGLLEMESYREPGKPPKKRYVLVDVETILEPLPDPDSPDTAFQDTGNPDTDNQDLNHYLLKPGNKESSKEINHPPAASAASRKHLHSATANREKGDDEIDYELPASRQTTLAEQREPMPEDIRAIIQETFLDKPA